MAVTINAKGTSSPHFRIGKQGTTVYQGTSDPSGSYTTAAGDMWIDTTNLVLKSRNSSNNGWESNLSGTGSINITGDATITGNLTVTGTTTVVDTTNLTVKDPLIILSEGTTGTPSSDAGIVVERGDSVNTGIIWDESADEWAVANTNETGSTAGNVTFTTYANIRANEFYGDGSNLSGISTTTTLAALTDTTVSGPADNEFLRYNGSAWINEAVTLTSTVAALTDTTISGPSSGQVLKYNGSAWINDADSATTTVTLSEMTGDGSDTTLTLEATPNSDDNLLVFVDSVLQDAGAWSRSGTTLTFSEAPANGAVIKAWDLLSSTATNAAKLDALTADSSTTAFTLQQGSSNYTPSHANCLLVSIGGVMQEPGAGKAFTVSGSTITFTEAPATGATIWIVDVGGGVTVNTPADDSVTSAKIVDGAIVNADINASAAIAKTKLASLDIVNADVNASAAIAKTKLASLDIVNADVNASAAIAASKLDVGGKNYVVNGGFDIWQRSFAITSSSYYQWYADRWNGDAYNGSGFLVTREEQGANAAPFRYWLRFRRPVSTTMTNQRRIGQVFETQYMQGMNGQAMTLSFYMKKGANWSPTSSGVTSYFITGEGFNEATSSGLGHGWSGVATSNQGNTLTTSWQRFTHTFTLSATANQLAIQFVAPASVGTAGAADDWDIGGVKLELGSTATPYINEDIGDTLDKCERFYQKSYNIGHPPGTVTGLGSSSTTAIYSSGSQHGPGPRFSKRMRVSPTVAIYSPSGASGNAQQTSNNVNVACTAGEIGEAGFQFITGSLPTGDTGMRYHWVAEAEL